MCFNLDMCHSDHCHVGLTSVAAAWATASSINSYAALANLNAVSAGASADAVSTIGAFRANFVGIEIGSCL